MTKAQGPQAMITRFCKRLCDDATGGTAIEYGLIVGLIAVGMVAALWGVAEQSERMWDRIETRTTEAMAN